LTKAAIADLQAIRDYALEMWGKQQEAAYLRSLWAKFRQMLETPERFRRREDLFKGCRLAAEGRHVILFCIEGETLQIARILHSAMDLKRHVPPGD
jgi:toxin ParE1/3/4